MSEENIFDNVQSITYHFSKDGLLNDWREEALRHREQLSEALELINQLKDLYIQQCKEIERLNNRIEKAIDFLKENACIDEDVGYFCDDLRYDDCKTLLEILDKENKQ